MRRRGGMSLIEALLACAVLGTALIAVYGSLTDAMRTVARVDRRAQAEAISLNIHERHSRTNSRELLAKFGGPDRGVVALREDPVLTSSLPESWDALQSSGTQVSAQAVSLSSRAGDRAVHFTTEVVYTGIDGRTHVVSHARVLGSGLGLDASPFQPAEEPAVTRAFDDRMNAPLLPLEALDERDDRLRHVRLAMGGHALAAPVVFRGPQSTLVHLRDTADRSISAAKAAAATGGSSPSSRAAVCLPPSDDARSVLRQWQGLEAARVPPGDYRVNGKRYDQPIGAQVMHLELLRLQPLTGTAAEARWMLARHTAGPQGILDDLIEGKPVLERRTVQVRAAGPDLPSAPRGLTATVERTADRLYVTRPSFRADGVPAVFGRELAVTAWDGEENGSAGAAGKAAWDRIRARWCLSEESAADAALPPLDEDASSAEADWDAAPAGPPAHLERLEVTLAQAPTVSNVAVEVVSADASVPVTNRSDERKREAIQLIKEGKTAEAAAMYDELDAGGHLDAASLANRAAVLIERGDLEGAERAAQRALDQSPEHSAALLNFALSLELRGRTAEAREAFAKGVLLHPDSAAMKAGLQRTGGGR